MAGLEDLGITRAELDAILASPEVTDAKVRLAEQIRDYWREVSPELTGEYKDSIEVQVDSDVVKVVATDEKASYIEFGTSDTPEHAPRAKTQAKFAREE
jgi:hypothetical protein